MEKISIIIPTYNRFCFLIETIRSIKNQTYSNIEIIVVNDRSTQKEYYEYDWNDITVIHLAKNTKELVGYASPAFVRNQGIKIASGKYIAFCDDDDTWLPNKLELQIEHMKKTGCKMSCTDGFMKGGNILYNETYYYNEITNIHRSKGSQLMDNGFPYIWDYNFVNIHNSIICSSVLVEKDILTKIDNFKNMKPPGEDYDCWLRLLQYTDIVYVNEPCFYYDLNHGNGRNYSIYVHLN
jgi:glycosyltransferase involved in cell wall biosynthesis